MWSSDMSHEDIDIIHRTKRAHDECTGSSTPQHPKKRRRVVTPIRNQPVLKQEVRKVSRAAIQRRCEERLEYCHRRAEILEENVDMNAGATFSHVPTNDTEANNKETSHSEHVTACAPKNDDPVKSPRTVSVKNSPASSSSSPRRRKASVTATPSRRSSRKASRKASISIHNQMTSKSLIEPKASLEKRQQDRIDESRASNAKMSSDAAERSIERVSVEIANRAKHKGKVTIIREFYPEANMRSRPSRADLKKAFRNAMAKFHPDKSGKLSLEESVRAEEIYKLLSSFRDQV